ncbi:carbon starvation CstA family protein [Neomoorella mulderi]|uniref:Carbon starvation protein A n=1 Tax=Moorella mulderi DSM 14980 TaxID=1122241 RepID=A0A151B169_9FIRM|nr:carbon starvation protein A [Moorella mulderi]KYH33522.1 carbon starvation protein A [Moorella mulderi DSM 14980]
MITFWVSIVILVVGYFLYGTFVERVFAPQEQRPTPAVRLNDGVDYVPMDWKRDFLIQLLNIAGLGPIFGAIQGALWGPVAFIWIVLGGIFAGAVHDYLVGMLSVRHDGANLPAIVGNYLGSKMKQFVNIFTVIVLILVGTVFMTGPAQLLTRLTPESLNYTFWLGVILVYYLLATILPIDKIIGRIYPLFGAVLIIMAVGIVGGIMVKGYHIPELTLANLHPQGAPLWPLLFITIACGAISGFHATQSPIIARCLENERYGRRVFYGAMIVESIIALIWAAAAMTFFGGTNGLANGLKSLGGPAGVVNQASFTLLGTIGGVLAVLGVIVLPVTSGDTAFRAARLTIAEFLGLKQGPIINRYKIAIPIFTIGFILSQIDFTIVWRYFAWSNQTLAMIALWAAAVYLARQRSFHWVATLPATFMTAVSITYILQAPEGLHLATSISYPVGIAAAALTLLAFLWQVYSREAVLSGAKPKPETR